MHGKLKSCITGTWQAFTQMWHFSLHLPGMARAVTLVRHKAWCPHSCGWEVTVGTVVLCFPCHCWRYSCSLCTMRGCRWSFTFESLKACVFLFNFSERSIYHRSLISDPSLPRYHLYTVVSVFLVQQSAPNKRGWHVLEVKKNSCNNSTPILLTCLLTSFIQRLPRCSAQKKVAIELSTGNPLASIAALVQQWTGQQ